LSISLHTLHSYAEKDPFAIKLFIFLTILSGMPLKKIRVKNFKCLEDIEMEVRPLTILIGPSGSGKSSILQALLLLKKFVVQSNLLNLDILGNFTDIDYLNLGRYEELVYKHDTEKNIEVGIDVDADIPISYTVVFSKYRCKASLSSSLLKGMNVEFTLPYPLNVTVNGEISLDRNYKVIWNGITLQAAEQLPQIEQLKDLNPHLTYIRGIYFISNRNYFRSWSYGYGASIDYNQLTLTDLQLINILALYSDIEEKVATWCKAITDTDMVVKTLPGNLMKLESRYKIIRVPIVLDGAGINRLVYIFSMLANKETKLLLLEEPEVNMHPKLLFELGRHLPKILKEESKQVMITTHSEHLLLGVLVSIAEGLSSKDDVAIYSMQKEGLSAKAKMLKINEIGQIEGGIEGFFEVDWDITTQYINAIVKSKVEKHSE